MLVTIDYETYYSAEYSLSRMSEVDYILSPTKPTKKRTQTTKPTKPSKSKGSKA